jgi:hypothetical protein
MKDSSHVSEIDRLWRAIWRDLGSAVREGAGLQEGRAGVRLLSNWDKFCQLDLKTAACIWNSLNELNMVMAKYGDPNGPQVARDRMIGELLGMAKIGRVANPNATCGTLDDFARLGQETIRDEIDRETGGANPGQT